MSRQTRRPKKAVAEGGASTAEHVTSRRAESSYVEGIASVRVRARASRPPVVRPGATVEGEAPTIPVMRAAPATPATPANPAWRRTMDPRLLAAAHMLSALERSVLDQVDGVASAEAIAARMNEGVGAIRDVLRRLANRGLVGV